MWWKLTLLAWVSHVIVCISQSENDFLKLYAEFLKARNLTVSAVKDRSATFTWYHNPKNNIHDIQFKVRLSVIIKQADTVSHTSKPMLYIFYHQQLLCAGMHMYTEGERAIEEATTFQHVSWSTSNAQETVVANTLIPITKYVCHIRSVAGTQSSHIQDKVAFTTLQGSELDLMLS